MQTQKATKWQVELSFRLKFNYINIIVIINIDSATKSQFDSINGPPPSATLVLLQNDFGNWWEFVIYVNITFYIQKIYKNIISWFTIKWDSQALATKWRIWLQKKTLSSIKKSALYWAQVSPFCSGNSNDDM